MYKLYQMQDSGNCYKIRLLLSQLEKPFTVVEIDILKGESRTRAFLSRNPNGRVPTLEIATGKYLAESTAILWYLAENTAFLPADRYSRAQVLQWMAFEQYSHEPYIATSRFWISILKQPENHAIELAEKRGPGYAALEVMEQHLATHEFFAGAYSIADIALFGYTHVCHEGGFSLENYPSIRRWISSVQSMPNHISMTDEIPPHSPD